MRFLEHVGGGTAARGDVGSGLAAAPQAPQHLLTLSLNCGHAQPNMGPRGPSIWLCLGEGPHPGMPSPPHLSMFKSCLCLKFLELCPLFQRLETIRFLFQHFPKNVSLGSEVCWVTSC